MRKIINLNKKENANKGITLIVLVITIIVLLILAGVTILTLTGENGILGKSKTATEETQEKTATEIINLKITNAQIKSYSEEQQMPNLQYLADRLYEDNEIEYIYNKSQKMASKEKIKVTGKYIYTKLEEYPYEFEIDDKLRLASIDGVKVADSTNKEDSVSKEEYNALLERLETLENKVSIQETNEPTGIKTDAYITNELSSTAEYNTVTSMNGFTKGTDNDNKIAEYLAYDSTNGYTVLKSGWYFITMTAYVYGDVNVWSTVDMHFYVDRSLIATIGNISWAENNINQDSFPIFLKEGQKFYFVTNGRRTAQGRIASGSCRPMF